MSVNKAILLGRLGKTPELRYTQNGVAVASFSIATKEIFKDQSGNRQERTEWHNIVVWGKQAEFCKQYLEKGREIYLEGKITTRKWTDNAGQTKYTTEIIANSLSFVGGSNTSKNSSDNTPDEKTPSFDDDLPF